MGKRALIIEGGGMKATFAHGVLLAFEDADYYPWDAVYGNSAGGAIAAWMAAKQLRYGIPTWDYVSLRRYMSYGRALLRRGPMLDQDGIYEVAYERDYTLDIAAVQAAPWPVHVVAANCDTGQAAYPDIRKGNTKEWVKATVRLPLGSNGPVEIDGERWVDGGCVDSIPLIHVLSAGYTDITIIMNQPPGVAERDAKLVVDKAAQRFPALAQGLREHVARKAAAWALAVNPPPGVTVHLIHPDEPTGISRLSRKPHLIARGIALGTAKGADVLSRTTGKRQP